jgi:hypothetical protein
MSYSIRGKMQRVMQLISYESKYTYFMCVRVYIHVRYIPQLDNSMCGCEYVQKL